jgi:hypothetical protein
MNGARDDLLAGPGLAEEEHRRAAASHHLGARHHRGEPSVAADQPLVPASAIAGNQVFGKGSGGWRWSGS